IETAKFNVLTAYSADEALAMLRRFPAVDGVVMDAEMPESPCPDLVRSLKALAPSVPVIIVHRPLSEPCSDANHQLDTFDPKQLLSLLQSLCPEHTEAVEKRDEMLKAEEKEKDKK
ncbi:MAG TPA: response regulator, partial [Acidobacteriaceae bacterium]|nr:response regulator [Acidobacteriaceae bacterium]